MPIKHAIWTVGDRPAPLALTKLATERQVEVDTIADRFGRPMATHECPIAEKPPADRS